MPVYSIFSLCDPRGSNLERLQVDVGGVLEIDKASPTRIASDRLVLSDLSRCHLPCDSLGLHRRESDLADGVQEEATCGLPITPGLVISWSPPDMSGTLSKRTQTDGMERGERQKGNGDPKSVKQRAKLPRK